MALVSLSTAAGASAQSTTLLGSQFAARSTGALSGPSGWSVGTTGFVGSYLVVPAGGATINFTLNAAAGGGAGASPHVNIAVADSSFGFELPSAFATNYVTPNVFLPGGTYFVRTERDFAGNVSTNRASILNSLSVNTVGGGAATFANLNTATNALAAADTYIQNFRRGSATVALTGPGNIPLLPGTQVQVDLARHAFSFGTAVPGVSSTNVNSYLGSSATAQQTNYQARLNQHFNAVVPENAGKWASNENTRDVNTVANIDTILNYAQSRNMRARMHNGIWGSQQPGWATTLLSQAAAGSLTAHNDLRAEITERIGYYVGTGAPSDRANKYHELDLYNESVHTGVNVPGSYWNVYGINGIADIHREIKSVAPNLRLFVNEYNVHVNMDRYANWFSQHTEQLRRAGLDAGYGDVVGGIGTQYYVGGNIQSGDPNAGTASNSAHNAARIMQTMQNLSTHGLPISLTEFGVSSGVAQAPAAQILSEALRITFGNANANGFFMWGFHAENGGGNLFAPSAALFNVSTSNWNNWTITEAGKAWQDLLGIADWDGNPNNAWDTNVTAIVNPDGSIAFTGFFGDYNIGGQSLFSNLNLIRGTSEYSLSLAAPPGWHFWNTSASGNWSSAGNWTNGVADGIGQTAHFGQSVSPRTVTVDAPVVVGMINFDSVGTYTIGGSGTATLAGPAGIAAVNVVGGSHTIAAPVALNANLNVNVASPASTLLLLGGLNAPTRTVNKSGAGAFTLANLRVSALNVLEGAVVVSPSPTANDPAGRSTLVSWSISGDGRFDLTNNSLIVNYPEFDSPIEQIRQDLADGRLMTSLATAAHRLGYADDGAKVDVAFTFAGDTDLDGDVDVADLGNLASAWQTSGLWTAGDFDYSGFIDVSDLGMLASNWQAGVSAGQLPTGGHPWAFADALQSLGLPAGVPEPAAPVVLSGLLVWFGARRARGPVVRRGNHI
jgi:GH35 family endo-1,4-beta-xylanase